MTQPGRPGTSSANGRSPVPRKTYERRPRRALTATEELAERLAEILDDPPRNVAMERETIATLLCGNPVFCGVIFAALDPKDFYDNLYGVMFAELRRGWEKGVPFDTTGTLLEWLKEERIDASIRERAGLGPTSAYDWETFLDVLRCDTPHYTPAGGTALYYSRTLRRLRWMRDAMRWLVWSAKKLGDVDVDNAAPVEWFNRVGGKFKELQERAEKVEPGPSREASGVGH